MFILLLIIAGFQSSAPAQNGQSSQREVSLHSPSGYDSVVRQDYPPDQTLINGVIHKDFYTVQQGHPFLENDTFRPGSVNIGGQVYRDLLLRYNLYRQQLEMEYSYREKKYRIYLIDDPVEAFSLGALQFRKLSPGRDSPEYYQVIATSHFNCYIRWEKIRLPIPDGIAYLDESRTFLMETGQGTEGFKSNRQFLKFFKKEDRVEIRRFFHARSFYFSKATAMEILTNLNEVDALIESRESL